MEIQKHILLIDDDLDDQEFFVYALTELNTTIAFSIANNGLEAVEKIKIPPKPSLIFIDLNMPVMNGFEFLEAIKKEPDYKDIPTIILTTSNSESDKSKAKKLGASRFITKPSNLKLLKEHLQEILSSELPS
jgi:CheY-like chemotaxis protein